MNTQFTRIVQKHAKQAKVGQERLKNFYTDVIRSTVKPHRVQSESDLIRDTILAQKMPFVSRDLAEDLGVSRIAVNNNLYALQRLGVVKPTGNTVKLGGRGKPAVEWTVI